MRKNIIAEVEKATSFFYKLDPMSTPITWYSGSAHFRLGNVPEAFADFKRSYESHPYHVHCINNLATCYKLMGNQEEAIRLYEKAIHLHPRFEGARVNLSIIYLKQHNNSMAYQVIRGIQNNNKNNKVHTILNRILSAKIDSMLKTVHDVMLMKTMNRIGSEKNRLIDIHFKSVKNDISFEHQLLIDAINTLEAQRKNDIFGSRIDFNQLREDYLTVHQSKK